VIGPFRRLVAAWCLAAAVAATTVGCAPGTPDGDSWRIDAQRAVSDASSAVQTAELALRQHGRGRVFDRYLQTVLGDAEKGVGKASEAIGSKQPPRAERERYDAVTGQLDEAAGLVSTARIAVVDRETDRYDALADRLASAADALQKLQDDLQHPPVAAG
jgi:broad specificity phosphatase PhoE